MQENINSDCLKVEKEELYMMFFLLAFIMVLATFFGVNWLLGGMHSYA